MDQQQLDQFKANLERYKAAKEALEWHKARYGLRGSVGKKLEAQNLSAWLTYCVDNGPENIEILISAIDDLQADNAQLRAELAESRRWAAAWKRATKMFRWQARCNRMDRKQQQEG